MKKISTLILCVGISISVLGQKKELKTAQKLMKKSGDYAGAAVELAKAKDLVVDTKYQAQYYYLMGVQAFGNETTNDYVSAGKYFTKTLDQELESGNMKYTDDAKEYIKKIKKSLYDQSNAFIKSKDFTGAGDVYKKLYEIEPGRKDLLETLTNCRIQSGDYDEAAAYIEKKIALLGDNFYYATDGFSSSQAVFFTKEDRDAAVKRGTHKIPYEDAVGEDVEEKIYSDLVALYTELGYTDKKEKLLGDAIKKYPSNALFLQHYADIVQKTGDKNAYVKVLEDALASSPDNKVLWYNLGVTSQELGNFEKAGNAYDKALEIDPEYRNVYINKGLLALAEEKSLVDELNESQGTKNYIVVKRKIEAKRKEALPFFEKAYELEKEESVRSMLKNIYNSLGESAKADAL